MKLSQQRIFAIEKFVSFSEKHKAMGIAEGLSKFSKISKVNNKLKILDKKKNCLELGSNPESKNSNK